MNDQIEQIEISMEDAKKTIATMDSLKRLTENKDFKEIILEGYFKEEASRVVLLRATPNMLDEDSRKMCDEQIIAIGQLRQYLSSIFALGGSAKRALEADEGTHAELLAEDAAA